MKLSLGFVLAVAVALAPAAARAHELRPALLSVTQTAADHYEVELRVPMEAMLEEGPTPEFPAGSERVGATTRTRFGTMVVERFRVRVPGGLAGNRVGVHFSRGVPGEVLVRVATSDGRTSVGRMASDKDVAQGGDISWRVPAAPSAAAVAGTYLRLGVEHILTGLDHLAFVLALVLLTPAWRRLWKTITAFTAAHSLTLALAATGVVRLPPLPVEATIALTIVFVAREVWLAQHGRPGSIAGRAWPVAFAFGLLHGLGFAGALAEVGLPESDVPLALLSFNIGVELGQLAFVAAVLLFGRALSRARWAQHPVPRLAPAYVIGGLAAFWCIDRVARFWS
jgi:hydrogenase/urease accessory protein HupE